MEMRREIEMGRTIKMGREETVIGKEMERAMVNCTLSSRWRQ